MKIKGNVFTPPYFQIKTALRSLIEKGEVRPGDRISSEVELQKKYGVARNTVRRALKELENEGWLRSVPGKGTFCTPVSQRNQKDRMIGVILRRVTPYIYPQFVKGINEVVYPKGYSVIVEDAEDSFRREAERLDKLISMGVKGIVLTRTLDGYPSPNTKYFLQSKTNGIPLVFMDSSSEEVNTSYVRLDDIVGAYQAVKYLIKLGHKRIGCIMESDCACGLERLKGYKKALKEYGIEYDDRLITTFKGQKMRLDFSHYVKEILDIEDDRPTALFLYNDLYASYAYIAIKDSGLQIPQDISVIGYDDSEIASLLDVPLTTVVHPTFEMGKKTARLLLQHINGELRDFQHIIMKPSLIIRESCAEPKKALK